MLVKDLIKLLNSLDENKPVELFYSQRGSYYDIKSFLSSDYGSYFLYSSKNSSWVICPVCEGNPVNYNIGGFTTCSNCCEIGFVKIK